MLRTVIKRAFANISNKQPIHIKNKALDQQRAFATQFKSRDDSKIRGNFVENYDDPVYLERNQIQTRILKVLYDSELVQRLDKFDFSQDMRKQLNFDSLNITVVLTSIEHQFNTVFVDNVFQSVRNLQEIITILVRDPKIY